MAEPEIDWHAWIGRHGPAALLYALQISPTRADAQDAVHDGFVRFWSRRETARNLPALFFTCVRSAALDSRRGAGRRRKREQVTVPDAPWFEARQELESREQIEQALRQLPDEQREVVVLKVWGDLTFAEVAEVLRESPNTVATRYRMAMEKMRQVLMPEVEHE